MQIPVIIEPAFQASAWCQQLLSGMTREAQRKKYALQMGKDIPDEPQGQHMIVVGTSVSWVPQVLEKLENLGHRAILINYDSFALPSLHSCVRMDYVNAMQNLMGYFNAYGRRRMALLGVNPDSSADCTKTQFFAAAMCTLGNDPQACIFPNLGNVQACLSNFLPRAARFDAVICANDLVAIYALRQLQKIGLQVPEDIFLAGFGESMLSQRITPSLTTVTLDHEEMGRQAVMLFAYLHRQSAPATAVVRLEAQLAVRQTTASLPFRSVPLSGETEPATTVHFYADAEIQKLQAMEDFHRGLDALDQQILEHLAQGLPAETIAECCHTSSSTVGYRIRSMKAKAGVSTRQELLQAIFP